MPPGAVVAQQVGSSIFATEQMKGARYQTIAGLGDRKPAGPYGAGTAEREMFPCGPNAYPRVADLGTDYRPDDLNFLARLARNGPAGRSPDDAQDYMRLPWSANLPRRGGPPVLVNNGGWYSAFRNFQVFPGTRVGPPGIA